MRKALLFIFLFISIFLLSEIQVDASRGISVISDLSHRSGKLGAYRALIIGINDYKDPKIPDLETAVNDAKAISELLRERYGFKVKLLLNQKATKEAIYHALRNLASSSKPNDSVLIYYSGHGDLDRTYDDGWWIPADAKGGNPVTYLDNVQVQKSMRSMKARHVLLISDSCYSGTLFGQARAMPQVIDDKYYLNLYNEKSRWGMTSGNKTPVSDAGTGGHSVFAYQLIKALRKNEKPYISTQEIYTRIAPIVSNNSEQMPLCRPVRNTGDQGGEFVFVASAGKTIQVEVESAQLPSEDGVSFDDILKASETKRKAVDKWNKWQQSRERDYQKVKQIDKDTYLSPKQKAIAWQRFLASVSQNNPYSRQDDEMRSYSRSRASHWEDVKPTKKIEPSTVPILSASRELELLNQVIAEEEKEVTGRDGTLIAYGSGVVYDKNTDLEWVAGPDRDTNWYDAKRWVENLNVAGGGWRMPTERELKTLYKKGAGSSNMTPLLHTTGYYVWSGETKGSSLDRCLRFVYWLREGRGAWYEQNDSIRTRGFAVRFRR